MAIGKFAGYAVKFYVFRMLLKVFFPIALVIGALILLFTFVI